jgi:hypothetical protein
VPRKSVEHLTKLVAQALEDAGGSSLNTVSASCGGSIAMSSQALTSLETQGRARFEGGRWYPVPAPPDRDYVDGEVAAAARVRRRDADARASAAPALGPV